MKGRFLEEYLKTASELDLCFGATWSDPVFYTQHTTEPDLIFIFILMNHMTTDV